MFGLLAEQPLFSGTYLAIAQTTNPLQLATMSYQSNPIYVFCSVLITVNRTVTTQLIVGKGYGLVDLYKDNSSTSFLVSCGNLDIFRISPF